MQIRGTIAMLLSKLLSIDPTVVISLRSMHRAAATAQTINSQRIARRSTISMHAATSRANDDAGEQPAQATYPVTPTLHVPTAAEGLVMAAQANFVRVRVDRLEGSEASPPQPRLLCVVRALLKKMKREVLVGDRVRLVGIDWMDGRGMVEDVLPRESRLSEPPVANVSHALLVFSLACPPLQPSAATRYLVAVEASGIPVTIVLNKADLMDEKEAQEFALRVEAWGYHAITTSVSTGDGLQELEDALKGRTTVVAGPSGAGKSSIINALRLRAIGAPWTLEAMQTAVDGDLPRMDGMDLQAVGSVSERIGRGKHTTRNVALLEMEYGGLLADTPGFNQPTLNLPPDDLPRHFPEIRAILEKNGPCAFSDCQHVSEPGCVVREAEWERYSFYVQLLEELKAVEEETVQRAVGKKVREGVVRYKSRPGGKIGVEARLETKSHRRVNRRAVKQALSELVKDVDEDDVMPP